MESNLVKLLKQILVELYKNEVLEHFVLIGSWCNIFYKEILNYPLSPLRTRDIDFLITNQENIKKEVNITSLMEKIGFEIQHSYPDGHLRILNKDILIEFLIADKGKGLPNPYEIKKLHINSEPMRYMNILLKETMIIKKWKIRFQIPRPEMFILHKLIISIRRKNKEKGKRDYINAKKLANIMKSKGTSNKIKEEFKLLTNSEKKTIIKTIKNLESQDKIFWDKLFKLSY